MIYKIKVDQERAFGARAYTCLAIYVLALPGYSTFDAIADIGPVTQDIWSSTGNVTAISWKGGKGHIKVWM